MTMRRPVLRRAVIAAALAVSVLGGGAVAGIYAARAWLEPLALDRASDLSRLVVDREGRLLRPFATPEGLWRLPVEPEEVDPRFIAMLVAYEDKRFWQHGGVDPAALARAAWQRITTGRIVSGGSTLTMQVARLLEPREERTLAAKARQILRAWELEQRLSKRDILRLYLTLAPYGGNLEGIRAAALAYFGREPRRLSVAEAALLVALPQSPETRRPDRSSGAARTARDMVVRRLARAGVVSDEDSGPALAEGVPSARRPVPMLAAHLTERLAAESPAPIVRTTLDQRLQASLESLVRDRVAAIGPALSGAVVVVDNATGEVRARVGSAGYFDGARQGAVDMAAALRSPGSALKPAVYGLAFDLGLAHPETLVEDRPMRYGAYAPENFDLGHQGTLTVRRALQMSLNVPVVELMEAVRPVRFLSRLSAAGIPVVIPRDTVPGLAVGLGGVGITLENLARVYAGLARGGEVPSLTVVPGTAVERRSLLDPVSAWYVADILRGAPPPEGAAGGRFAFKTGTSYGYRDAWAVGFDRHWTIAVWVGRPDNAPVAGLTGRGAAAPILFDAVARMGRAPEPPLAPPGILLAATARLPPPLRAFGSAAPRFNATGEAGAGDAPLRIAFPPDGARLAREPGDSVALRATGGVPPLVWLVDGSPLGTSHHRRALDWTPAGAGFARVTVTDARGETATVTVRLE